MRRNQSLHDRRRDPRLAQFGSDVRRIVYREVKVEVDEEALSRSRTSLGASSFRATDSNRFSKSLIMTVGEVTVELSNLSSTAIFPEVPR